MIYDLLALVWIHYIADFLLQTDKQALNKSSSNKFLLEHIFFYGFALSAGIALVMTLSPTFTGLRGGYSFAAFLLVNMFAHYVTDYISSRIGKSLWQQGKRGAFFACVGADQAAHMTVLLITYKEFLA